jgi:2-keto-3-deoxy-L-rhamnonate aldolase RhmA
VRTSKTLAKLRDNKEVRIAGLGHFIPAFIKQAADAGYDNIWLDLEHRCMDVREVQALLAYFHAFDIDCMLRAPTYDRGVLYRYLEDGATGLMLPHVTTRDDAEHLVNAIKFPPIGNRGLDGAGFDCRFEIRRDPEYPETVNRETFLVVQIESPEAVSNVDEIASVPGVDGLFVGPGDLGLRLRVTNSSDTVEACEDRVAAAAAQHGKAWGRPVGTIEQAQDLRARGAQLLAYGGDFGFMLEGLTRLGGQLEDAFGG